MKRKTSILVAIIMMTCMFLVGCSGTTTTSTSATASTGTSDTSADDGQIKIILLHGKLGATSFIDEANAGRLMAEEKLGVVTEYVEIIENADYETQARFLAETGEYDLIIVVNTQIADILRMVAPDYPDQKFSIVDTRLDDVDNVHSVNARDPEQAFLSGVISGIVTKGGNSDAFPLSNDAPVLCYAGGTDNPTSRAGAAGYMAGARFVNPDVEILYTIVGSYNDPGKAKEIALTGIAQGADIVTGNCGAGIMGILEACKEQGAYYIATSPADNDAEQSLCCSVKRTDVFVFNEVESVLNGTWESGHTQMGIKEGACDVSLEGLNIAGKYPQEVLDIVDEIRQMVVDGKLELPYDVSEVDEWAAKNQYKW